MDKKVATLEHKFVHVSRHPIPEEGRVCTCEQEPGTGCNFCWPQGPDDYKQVIQKTITERDHFRKLAEQAVNNVPYARHPS